MAKDLLANKEFKLWRGIGDISIREFMHINNVSLQGLIAH